MTEFTYALHTQNRKTLCDTPPCDLHSIYNIEVCFGTHLRAICTVFTIAFEHWGMGSIYFGGALWGTPPRDLHSFYKCLWALDMGSFYFRRCAFRTPPRDLHSFYNNLCVSEVAPTWDFIILNKGRAKEGQGGEVALATIRLTSIRTNAGSKRL